MATETKGNVKAEAKAGLAPAAQALKDGKKTLEGIAAQKTGDIETKAQKFTRLANKRVPKLLKIFEHVSNLFSPATYEWTDGQASKIRQAIDTAYNRYLDKVNGVKKTGETFSL
jgi:hypothetical protein